MNSSPLLRAYALLGDSTPMLTDCGQLCGAACCAPDADGQGGVYLFPGEAALLGEAEWGRIVDTPFAPMLICDGPCKREKRPLGCRIFPLTPVRAGSGRWSVRMDARARAMCPLVTSGLGGLAPGFARAARDALRAIAETPEGEAFLERWQGLEEEYRKPLW